VMGEIVTRNM